ncbi:hypothetical protein SAMN05421858_3991 [Haladaptatus litoreus]|uniref:Uncharacterized protein n=1 Tax=Haladaptatus litoreus TaxID=553468 RepID=A0A1N7E3S6_9EURY|nr:hypothetical protein [Haladaptatus litoreus]SIR82686.1 hypothetical protein SAMN05421858_3991 [Haladaptatus litoreus]
MKCLPSPESGIVLETSVDVESANAATKTAELEKIVEWGCRHIRHVPSGTAFRLAGKR